MIKTLRRILNFARRNGCGQIVDKLIYFYQYSKNHRVNSAFIKNNPLLTLPPSYLLFESYKLNYKDYYQDGFETANWILNLFTPYIDLSKPIKILDWGCGPSRVVRHLPQLLMPGSVIYGSDYNTKTIEWNTKNVTGVQFIQNNLAPPLEIESSSLDAVYSISVFTHLSENLFQPWLQELLRIIRTDGILIITLHGDAFRIKLNEKEQIDFNSGNAIVHKSNIEGHRSFGAFHPKQYVERYIVNYFKIEKIIPGELINGIPQQDTWILRKNV